ncbi:MAG TPA: amidase [Planctomycetota bacterium]|nr:amidase [Planctomycetota bacterium]
MRTTALTAVGLLALAAATRGQAPPPAPAAAPAAGQQQPAEDADLPPVDELRAAGRILGLDFTPSELDLMRRGVAENKGSLQALRDDPLANSEPPATVFSVLLPGIVPHVQPPPGEPWPQPQPSRPAQLEDLAFADIDTLGALLRSQQVTCVELTRMFLGRLHRLDGTLHAVITFMDERALAQAARLDRELADGHDRGPLHGIPWGAKDLLSAAGYRTTWGSAPFEQQMIDEDAEVVRRLDAAGAVLCAKLTLGELAWGDVWFGGRTRNPWNPEQGSSGSSAGPAAAVAAGALPFAIGSETLGSIVSPSARCGCSSLRPTFGRVSRRGAMALSWTMDKLGPLCRSARDAALVFGAIQGPDPLDETTAQAGLPYAPPGRVDVTGWRVGYVPGSFPEGSPDGAVLAELRALGVELVPVELPQAPLEALLVILGAEAAEAFDRLTLDGLDDQMARQVDQAWPNVFRTSRLIPAVEYLRAQRLRRRLMQDMDGVMGGLDALVHPSDDEAPLMIGNLTGHPAVCAPSGFRDDGTPRSVSFTGRLFDEARLLALVQAWQATTDYHRKHPRI